jgi:hypothetical protein
MDTIRQRKSVRAFTQEPVPRTVLQEILEAAVLSPSWANTQPWEFIVAGGQVVKDLARACEERALSGAAMKPEIPGPPGFPEPFDGRRRMVGKKMFDVLGFGGTTRNKGQNGGCGASDSSMPPMSFLSSRTALFIIKRGDRMSGPSLTAVWWRRISCFWPFRVAWAPLRRSKRSCARIFCGRS